MDWNFQGGVNRNVAKRGEVFFICGEDCGTSVTALGRWSVDSKGSWRKINEKVKKKKYTSKFVELVHEKTIFFFSMQLFFEPLARMQINFFKSLSIFIKLSESKIYLYFSKIKVLHDYWYDMNSRNLTRFLKIRSLI